MTGIVVFQGYAQTVLDVLQALTPLVILFLAFQVFVLKMPKERVIRILVGMAFAAAGLSLFLQGVNVGFFPVGTALGDSLGKMPQVWLLIPIGFALGFVATIAEPAVRVLNDEVDKVSGGHINKSIMLWTLSIGVGVSVALAMARLVYGIPLFYILIPGFLLALGLIPFSSKTFVSIAFDSGPVATGVMVVTFLMAMTLGLAGSMEGRDPMTEGFGMVILAFLAPILSVLILGLLYGERRNEDDEGR